jgi:drug/metabolite transporter (DMT)-like permease
MNWFDFAAVLLVILAIADGATSGFGWAILETCMLFGTAVAAKALRPYSEEYVLKVVSLSPTEVPWITHLVVFALCGCSLFGLLLLLHPTTKKWRFPRDRWFGAAIGVLNGVLAAIFLGAIVMGSSPQTYDAALRDSHAMQSVASVWRSGAGAPFMPEHVASRTTQLWGE